MCTINRILFHIHGCANSHDGTSSILSMDQWLNTVCHCHYNSHALNFISSTFTYVFLKQVSPFIRNYLTRSICCSTILQQNLYHGFPPHICWYVQRGGAILRNPTYSANANAQKNMATKQMLHNIHFLPSIFACNKTKTHLWQHQSITDLSHCLRVHALPIGTTY